MPDPQTTEALAAPVHLIASHIDYPSVYMGGPSHRAVKLAERIWAALKAEGLVTNG